MEQIINYRDIPTDKRIDILNALERIGFFPAYGGVRTMQQIMEVQLYHIVFSKCTIKCRKCGGADCSKSP